MLYSKIIVRVVSTAAGGSRYRDPQPDITQRESNRRSLFGSWCSEDPTEEGVGKIVGVRGDR